MFFLRLFIFHYVRIFRNFALQARSYWHSEEKTNAFVLFISRFFVTLEEIAGFLYLKAV